MKKYLTVILAACTALISFQVNCDSAETDGNPAYRFDGSISREVLERYLDRSVTATYLLVSGRPEGYSFPYKEDDIRMVHNVGAKFIGRAIHRWGSESKLTDPEFISFAETTIRKMHEVDPDMIFQACLFEYVSGDVNNVPVPEWVFEAFGLPVEKRNFRSADMVKRIDPKAERRWSEGGGGVPMVNNLETRMWFYYLARIYIDMGCEALHLGQVELIGADDPGKEYYSQLIAKIREYAAKTSRRHYVLLDAHTPYGGFIKDGVSLLDFNSFPLRIKEVPENHMEGILEVGHSDSIFKRSKGGWSPSGWYAESLPYLVEFDNFGTNGNPGVANINDHWCWGYDDITWFATNTEEYRNNWLWYAFDWLRETDPNGHLQMCLLRMVTGEVGKTSLRFYFANTRSEACPIGYSQEETIKAIWEARLEKFEKPEYMDYAFWNPDLPMEERLDDLVGRLTLEEKVRQMINGAPAIPRLGIPSYDWWNECLHGVARTSYNTTSFPQAIGMAAAWDTEAMKKMAEYASDEGRAIFHDSKRKGTPGIFKGLTYWTPNINIFRDPRWGRGMETYGEDPFLTGEIGAAFVRGLQGDDPKYLKASACAKHYAVHSGPEWNRHTFDAYVSDHDLWDTYLPAFEKLVVEAGVSGVMTAYNRFLGQACSTSDVLMTDILFNKWNYKGYVTSDCGAIDDIFRNHKVYDDAASGSAAAVRHGNHCECGGGAYLGLLTAVEKGLISEEEIDSAVRRLFEIRMRLGMFDPDNRVPYASTPLSVLECAEHLEHAIQMARESIVLLKNENGLLPLDKKKVRKIAVIGPNADDEKGMLANYYGFPSEISTILEGIRQKAGENVEVVYHKGVNHVDNWLFNSDYDEACFSINGKKGFSVEYFQNTRWEGVSPYTSHDERIDHRWGNGTEVGNGVITNDMSAVWRSQFKAPRNGEICFEVSADDYATLFIDGKIPEKRGLINNYYILNAKKGRTYDIELRYVQHGDNADVKLDMGYLESADPQKLAASVSDADVIIFAGGLSPRLEGEEMAVQIDGFRRGDRTSIDLPAVQRETLQALVATGKPVVFVLMTGSAVGLGWESENVPAIVNAWYGGQRGGEAVAEVLFGEYNPAGRLPVTFYRSAEDLPDFENYSMQNRTYRYFQGTPVYPFGYGLSYTTFEYSDISLEALADGSLKVAVNVRNAGDMDGDEVVQVYLSNKRDFTAPIRSLKAFDRINLKAGESRRVEFVIPAGEVTLVDMYGKKVPMAGDVTVSVGGGQPGYGQPGICEIIKL